MSAPFVYTSRERISDCCGREVYDDQDICPDCGEHCTVLIPCEDCNGEGYTWIWDATKRHKIIQTCEFCEEGWKIE